MTLQEEIAAALNAGESQELTESIDRLVSAHRSRKELAALVEAEEQRLGVGSNEFMDRHAEIMQLIEQCQKGESHGRKML